MSVMQWIYGRVTSQISGRMDIIDEVLAWLDAARRAKEDPNSVANRMLVESRCVNGYLDDPSISDHDKDLQYVLDHDLKHPDDVLHDLQEDYDRLCWPEKYLYEGVLGSHGYASKEEEMRDLEDAMSEEAIADRKTEYEEYLALREEALRKGFVRHGNCRNLR